MCVCVCASECVYVLFVYGCGWLDGWYVVVQIGIKHSEMYELRRESAGGGPLSGRATCAGDLIK